MKTLLILRHAKSSWSNLQLGDHDRPLSGRGKADAPRMGKLLADEGLVPELIISSTARRAVDTAEAVADGCAYRGQILKTRRLYHAGPDAFIELIREEAPDDCQRLMLVGHNPGLEMLLTELTGMDEMLTTANIAHIELPIERWSQLKDDESGKLIHVWRPKELD